MTAAIEVGLNRLLEGTGAVGVLAVGPRGYSKLCIDLGRALTFIADETAAMCDEEEAFRLLLQMGVRDLQVTVTRLPDGSRILELENVTDRDDVFLGFDRNSYQVGSGPDRDFVAGLLDRPGTRHVPPDAAAPITDEPMPNDRPQPGLRRS